MDRGKRRGNFGLAGSGRIDDLGWPMRGRPHVCFTFSTAARGGEEK